MLADTRSGRGYSFGEKFTQTLVGGLSRVTGDMRGSWKDHVLVAASHAKTFDYQMVQCSPAKAVLGYAPIMYITWPIQPMDNVHNKRTNRCP